MKYKVNFLTNWSWLLVVAILCSCQSEASKYAKYSAVDNGHFPTKIQYASQDPDNMFYEVVDIKNEEIYPAQAINDSTILFLARNANSALRQDLKVVESNEPFFENSIHITKNQDALQVTRNGKAVLAYQMTEQLPAGNEAHFKRGGFIHPIYSPNGKILSDDFPVGHTHQHGVFFAFVNTTYKGEKLDFWNQMDATGKVEFSKINGFESGPVYGKFQSEQKHSSIKHGLVLNEIWNVTIYNTEPYRIELETTLTNVSTDTLFIEDYRYGGMAFRGAKEWSSVDSMNFQNEPKFSTSEGTDRIAANHSRPHWSAFDGLIDGKNAGLAMLGHPSNFRYPEPIRIHPSMTYFCIAPMVGERFYVAPNDSFHGNYTLISFDGALPVSLLDKITNNLEK